MMTGGIFAVDPKRGLKRRGFPNQVDAGLVRDLLPSICRSRVFGHPRRGEEEKSDDSELSLWRAPLSAHSVSPLRPSIAKQVVNGGPSRRVPTIGRTMLSIVASADDRDSRG
jgi:hypothetical protein